MSNLIELPPLAPGYTPRQAELDAEMVALGRPVLPIGAFLDPTARGKHAAACEAWEYANPVAAAKWFELRSKARAEDDRLFADRYGPQAHTRELMRRDGFEEALIDRAFKELSANACFRAARDWARDGTTWSLTLIGPPGCGKTQAATWAAFQLFTRNQFSVRCARCPKVSESPLYGGEGEEYRWRCAQAGVLVLDDLGEGEQRKESKSAWRAWVDDVLTQRYAARRKTIITTNRTQAELSAWLSPRIADRLNEGVIESTREKSMRGAVNNTEGSTQS